VLWTAHKGAPHIGALFIFKGQKTRFRPIFSAIPHGSFFLSFAPCGKQAPVITDSPATRPKRTGSLLVGGIRSSKEAA
ncbi:MAG: hypothetical protein ABSE80_11930, partial [Halobacteriota archaeon]